MITFRGLYETSNLGPVMAPTVLGKIRARAQANDQVMYDVERCFTVSVEWTLVNLLHD